MDDRTMREWIPLEDLYFEKMEIEEKADIVISVSISKAGYQAYGIPSLIERDF